MGMVNIDKLGVFQVYTGDGTGSGFLISDRLLVTNCHVVAPYRVVAVEQRDKRRVVGVVRRLHPRRDLAIVELAEPFEGEVLPLSAAAELEPNQELHIVGFPMGLPLSITEGVVSNPKQILDGQHFVQTDAAINPGNSGGPMMDAQKHVVAVTTCKLVSGDMVGFGIPSSDVQEFVASFHEQSAAFGVTCPSCAALLETADRYCDNCGSDLESLELGTYFEPPPAHPMAAFVERGLANAKIDPVLARHGTHNWSFFSGSAQIKVWSCCSEHLCFSAPLAVPGKKHFQELFRFLLSPEHTPFAFDLADDVIRLNLTFHMSDIFRHTTDDEMSGWIARFIEVADRYDNLLVDTYGCTPAPESQLTFLKEKARAGEMIAR